MSETVRIENEHLVCKTCGHRAGTNNARLEFFADRVDLLYTCDAGHENVLRMSIIEADEVGPAVPEVKKTAVRTKVSGVTFENQDGTQRQDLLRHVKAGDALQIVKAPAGSSSAYMVKHALGILGTIRRETIPQAEKEEFPLDAIVTHITGGTAEKTTLGCNIEIYTTYNEPLSSETETPKKEPREQTVYIEKEKRSIYHMDRHCSGMKDAVQERLSYAQNVLKARPCKRCATEKGD